MCPVVGDSTKAFWSAGQLEKLTLNGNSLTELPESMGGLASLRVLALHSNNLKSLPQSFTSLKVTNTGFYCYVRDTGSLQL